MENIISSNKSKMLCDASYLSQKYNQIINSADPYALIYLNIKNFRYFNTKFGTAYGDKILDNVFKVLSDWVENEEYVGYLHADNFALIVKCSDIDLLIYERLMLLIDKVYRIDDKHIHRNLYISMGIYKMENPEVDFHNALCLANLCRKETKSLSRRCSSMEVYDESLKSRYIGYKDLESKTAEAYKEYEFVNYLQPKVDLKTEEVVGAEVLLRWFDKDGKSIPLGDFLPILVENGYITLIDLDAFEFMCRHLEDRIKKNKKVVPISFNLSKFHFQDPNMVQDYINIFEKYNIPKELIEIELMESISFENADKLKKVVYKFKEYGFACALDDFGNGYSSFNVLLNAPLDTIKMDRQFFIENLNGDNGKVIKTIVELIHSLNMKVVAEGVESSSHIELLKSCGCDYVQGYYYYRPMPITEFDKLLDI